MSAEGTVLHPNVAPHLFPSKTPLKNTTLETNNGIVTIAPANIGVDFLCEAAEGRRTKMLAILHSPPLRASE
jgi:hypothetical protein